MINLRMPERARLVSHPPGNLGFADLCQLRIKAAELTVALRNDREAVKHKRIRGVSEADILIKEESPESDRLSLLMKKTHARGVPAMKPRPLRKGPSLIADLRR